LRRAILAAACGSSGSQSAPGATSISTGGLLPLGAGLIGPAGLRATVYQGVPTVFAFALDCQGRLVIVTGQLGPTIGTSALVAEWRRGRCSVSRLSKLVPPTLAL